MEEHFYIVRLRDRSHEIRPLPMEGFADATAAIKAERVACRARREEFINYHPNKERLEVLLPMLQAAVNG